MQQTEKYKLNLIEKTDTFSPEALNENTQKVESALAVHEGLVEEVTDGLLEQTADLDQRLKVVEVHKIAAGKYTSFNQETMVDLGFTPEAVIFFGYRNGMIIASDPSETSTRIVPNGFFLAKDSGYNVANGFKYYYLALA